MLLLDEAVRLSRRALSGLVVLNKGLLLQVGTVVQLTGMALPLGVSWLCIILLRGCVSFQVEQGNNIGHGYALNDDFSSLGGVLAQDTSDQLYSGASSNTGHDSVNQRDQMQTMRPHSFVPLQREPVPPVHRKGLRRPSIRPTEMRMKQNKPASKYDPNMFFVIPSTPVVRKPERANNGYNQHSSGFLMMGHKQNEVVEGVSFPTIQDLKYFIESMKTSYLKPGSDMNMHFQTAQKTLENEILSSAQGSNEESPTDSGSNSVRKKPAQKGPSENKVWDEPMNTEFQQGTNAQMSSESLSVSDPAISSSSLVSTGEYDRQDSGPGHAFYLSPGLEELKHVSSNFESLMSNFHAQGKNVQLTSDKLFEQRTLPMSSLSGEVRKPSGWSDKPSAEVPRVQKPSEAPKAHDVFSVQKPLSSSASEQIKPSSYGRSLYVNTRGNLSIPAQLHKHEMKPSPLVKTVSVDKASKDIDHPSAVQLLVSSGFHSSSNIRSPQRNAGHGNIQAARPHDPQGELSTTKQPVKSHLGWAFNVKPSSFHNGSSGHDDYLSEHRVDATHRSVPNAQAEGQEKSDLSTQNKAPIIQEQKHMTNNKPYTQIPVFTGFDSTQNGLTAQASESDGTFNAPPDPAPSSEPKEVLASLVASDSDFHSFHPINRGKKGMFRNTGTNNMISSGFPGTFNPNIMQKNKVSKQIHRANIKEPSNVMHRPAERRPVSKGFYSACSRSSLDQRNGGYENSQRRTLRTGSRMPCPLLPIYIVKSRNGYVRGKMFFSQTLYMPSWRSDGKVATSRHGYKSTRSQNVKGLEVQ
ncbi:uncharacterized protein LOC115360187 [Myripristis murdjan]|uniref:uncharacterized protein LOC115360187 n=1 Tax=Myripristis murdjan TaxID=586833 RepID=UPI001175D3F6|nr:uncharacterized protein LOC115360187 [Myripristis murdjan]